MSFGRDRRNAVVIFVDESGLFANLGSRPHSVSCIVALVVPEAVLEAVLREFASIESDWADLPGELKGSKLSERRMARLITMLGNHDVVVVMVAIDMGLHPEEGITGHKLEQKARFTRKLPPECSEKLRRSAEKWGDRVAALPNQLYVQAVLMIEVAKTVIQTATFYYSQTAPATLGAFSWRIDAKDRRPTEYEEVWSFIVKPALQSASLQEPVIFYTEGDYGAFATFDNPDQECPPDYLKDHVSKPDAVFSSFALNRIMDTDRTFADSRTDPGLRIADVLANGCQRACNGWLAERGWNRLGYLAVKDPGTRRALQLVTLLDRPTWSAPIETMPYADVVARIERSARPSVVTRGS
jgi:hypothetical protein